MSLSHFGCVTRKGQVAARAEKRFSRSSSSPLVRRTGGCLRSRLQGVSWASLRPLGLSELGRLALEDRASAITKCHSGVGRIDYLAALT